MPPSSYDGFLCGTRHVVFAHLHAVTSPKAAAAQLP